jgi:hypothetical protein
MENDNNLIKATYINHTFYLITRIKEITNKPYTITEMKEFLNSRQPILKITENNHNEYYYLEDPKDCKLLTLNLKTLYEDQLHTAINSHNQILYNIYMDLVGKVNPRESKCFIKIYHLLTYGWYLLDNEVHHKSFDYETIIPNTYNPKSTLVSDHLKMFYKTFDKNNVFSNYSKRVYHHPARINQPLFPMNEYHTLIFESINQNSKIEDNSIFDNLDKTLTQDIIIHAHKIKYLKELLEEQECSIGPFECVKTTMDDILSIINEVLVINHPSQLNKDDFNMIINRLIENDIEASTGLIDSNLKFKNLREKFGNIDLTKIVTYDLLAITNKIRHSIYAKSRWLPEIKDLKICKLFDNIKLINQSDMLYFNENYGLFIFKSDNFVTLQYYATGNTYLMDVGHFDYLLTFLETDINLQFIGLAKEYNSIKDTVHLIKELKNSPNNYNNNVAFMKIYEGLCLMKSDIYESKVISWAPLIDVLLSIPKSTNIYYNILMFIGFELEISYNHYEEIIISLINKSPQSLIELSTLHKLYYFSEIDEDKGLNKYLSREFFNRPVNQQKVDKMVWYLRKTIIQNYYSKFNKLMEMECPGLIASEILSRLSKADNKSYDDYELFNFKDIVFKKNYNVCENKDPLAFAKDKGCSKSTIKYGLHDSIPELTDLLSRPHYSLSNNMLNYDRIQPKSVNIIKELDFEMKEINPVRLCMKEREQKVEGRLFGCATMDNKHELTYYNSIIEDIVRMFNNQFLQINDSDKKSKMHHAGQELLDENTYSILLDIEGHNQSMSIKNCARILHEIGLLYGIKNLESLSYYFGNLTVYYKYHSLNKSIRIKGQVGGIEGWMNPLWTLVTTIITDLFSGEHDIDVKAIMCYSDDINIIFKDENLHQSSINSLYSKLIHHYYEFGFLVKANQTMISKHRATLLRTHYYNGLLIGGELKKLLSISSITESFFINEQTDIENVVGSINSTLERTEKLYLLLYLKWFKISSISLRGYLAILFNREDNFTRQFMNAESQSFFINARVPIIVDENFRSENKELCRNIDRMYYDAGSEYNYEKMCIDFAFSKCINLLSLDNDLIDCWFLRLISPTELGGAGIPTLLNQIVIGHTNNFTKSMDNLLSYIHNITDENKRLEFLNQVTGKLIIPDKIDETILLMNEFPVFVDDEILQNKTIIDLAIKLLLPSLIKNHHIKNLESIKDEESVFKSIIVSLTKEKFSHRINNYLFSNSPFYLLQYLYNKITSSRSFIKRLPFARRLFEKLFHLPFNNQRSFFRFINEKPINGTAFSYNHEFNIVTNMTAYRTNCFNHIQFIDISEPVIGNKFAISDEFVGDVMLKNVKTTIMKEKRIINKEYLYPKGIKIKYDEEDNNKKFDNIILRLVYNNVFLLKWIAERNGILHLSDRNNLLVLVNITLDLLSNRNFNYLFDGCNLPTGGEIYHRLPNMSFQSKSYIKSLQKESLKFNVDIMSDRNFYNLYKDSNVNFSYFNNMILANYTLNEYFGDDKPKLVNYSIKEEEDLVRDVNIIFTYELRETNFNDLFAEIEGWSSEYFERLKDSLTLANLRLLDINLHNLMKTEVLIDQIGEVKNYLFTTIQSENEYCDTMVIQYFLDLCSNFLYIDELLSPDVYWLRLFERMRFNYNKINKMDFIEFKSYVKEVIKNYCNRIRYRSHYTDSEMKEIVDELQNDKIYGQVIKYLNKCISNVKDMEWLQTSLMKDNLKSMIDMDRELIIESLLTELLCRYSTVFKNVGGKIKIDQAKTLEFLFQTINLNYLEILDDKVFLLVRLIGKIEISEYLLNNITKLKVKINSLNNKLLYCQPVKRGKLIKRLEVKSSTEIPLQLINEVNYESFDLKEGIIHLKGSYFKKAINNFREIVEIYGHPDSLYSHTGSNSLNAGIGIGKYLLQSYPKKSVLDLTAGRGDFHEAFSCLGIRHHSVNRSDTFTDLLTLEGIEKREYDITKFNTIKFCLNYDIIVIDISHINYTSQLLDSIYNLVDNNKLVIVRINSLDIDNIIEFINKNQTHFSFRLIKSIGTKITPYQIYLEINKKDLITEGELIGPNSILLAIRQLIEYSLRIHFSDLWEGLGSNSNFNSTLNKYKHEKELNINQILDKYIKCKNNNQLIALILDIEKQLTFINKVIITKAFKTKLYYNIQTSNEERDLLQLGEHLFKLGKGSQHEYMQYNMFKRNIRDYTIINIFDLNKVKYEPNLSPFKICRELSNSLDYLYSVGVIDLRVDITKEYILGKLNILEMQSEKLLLPNLRYYEAIILLFYSKLNDNYKTIIRSLMFQAIKTKSPYYIRIIKTLKSITPYMDGLDLNIITEENKQFLNELGYNILSDIGHFMNRSKERNIDEKKSELFKESKQHFDKLSKETEKFLDNEEEIGILDLFKNMIGDRILNSKPNELNIDGINTKQLNINNPINQHFKMFEEAMSQVGGDLTREELIEIWANEEQIQSEGYDEEEEDNSKRSKKDQNIK